MDKKSYMEKLEKIKKGMERETGNDTIFPVFRCPECGAFYGTSSEANECCNKFEIGEKVVVLFGPFTERRGTISSIGKEGKYGVVLDDPKSRVIKPFLPKVILSIKGDNLIEEWNY
ncbi:MAG: hypothetical protein WCR33_03615 [Bacilli bacterium]